jgi:hypothetical protein
LASKLIGNKQQTVKYIVFICDRECLYSAIFTSSDLFLLGLSPNCTDCQYRLIIILTEALLGGKLYSVHSCKIQWQKYMYFFTLQFIAFDFTPFKDLRAKTKELKYNKFKFRRVK